ncbi:hypothetical protein GCM10022206_82080 [Streptomyces chiangmaiensis]
MVSRHKPQTLADHELSKRRCGIGSSIRDGALKSFANVFALLLTAGFITLPVSVMTGVVS